MPLLGALWVPRMFMEGSICIGTNFQSMATKHRLGRWNLKKYAKTVLFNAKFAVFWARNKLFEPIA